MNTTDILWKASRLLGKAFNWVYKYRAPIAVGASTIGTAVGVVMVAKVSMDIAPVVNDYRDIIDMNKDDKHALRQTKVNRAMFMAKSYAPWALLLIGSKALDIYACATLTHTANALAVALAAVTTQNKELRKAVKETDISEDEKEALPKFDGPSIYAKRFDENCTLYKHSSPLERYYAITFKLQNLNCELEHNDPHIIFLNDVYRAIEKRWISKIGQFANWRYVKDGNPYGDNEIVVRYYEIDTLEPIYDWPNGIDRPCWIDFNVDGGENDLSEV